MPYLTGWKCATCDFFLSPLSISSTAPPHDVLYRTARFLLALSVTFLQY